MYWWARQYPVTDAAQEAKVENTAVQAYQYFRDICSWRLLNHDAPLMLDGQGVVVHIGKSPFRHKPRVWYSCMASSLSNCQHFYHDTLQNHCGRPPPRQLWVFGICDTSHTLACGVMRIVPDSNSTAYNTATCSQWDNCPQ